MSNHTYDVQIREGTIVDGTRVPRYKGDVFIRDGKIVQLGGRPQGSAKQTINAEGQKGKNSSVFVRQALVGWFSNI